MKNLLILLLKKNTYENIKENIKDIKEPSSLERTAEPSSLERIKEEEEKLTTL